MATNNPQALKIVSLVLKVSGAIPLLIGVGLIAGAGFIGYRQYAAVKKWPTVDAEVVRSELTHSQPKFASDASPTTVYQAHIDFRYTAGGKQYTTPSGSDYSTSDYAEMKQKVDTYATGTHHAIRYNPANPNDIRFDAGFTLGFYMAPMVLGGVGLIFTITGAGLFFVGWAIGRAKIRCPSCGAMVRRTDQSCPNCGAAPSQGSAVKVSYP